MSLPSRSNCRIRHLLKRPKQRIFWRCDNIERPRPRGASWLDAVRWRNKSPCSLDTVTSDILRWTAGRVFPGLDWWSGDCRTRPPRRETRGDSCSPDPSDRRRSSLSNRISPGSTRADMPVHTVMCVCGGMSCCHPCPVDSPSPPVNTFILGLLTGRNRRCRGSPTRCGGRRNGLPLTGFL